MAPLQLCHAELIGVIVLRLLSKRNRAGRRVPLIVHCYAASLLTNISVNLHIKPLKKQLDMVLRFFSGQQVLFPNDKLSVGLCKRRGKCAGRRWQVASCH